MYLKKRYLIEINLLPILADRGSNLMSAGFWLEDFLTLGYRNPRCFFPLIWHEASKYSTISRISFSKFNLGISQGSWKNNEFQIHNFKTFEITDNLEISKNLALMDNLKKKVENTEITDNFEMMDIFLITDTLVIIDNNNKAYKLK